MDDRNLEASEKKKVAVYLRVSSDEQIEMHGIDHQRSKILSYIRSRDRELPSEDYIFYDAGVSGTLDIERRPALKSLFEKLEYAPADGPKPFDTIIVYKIDRFARRLSVLLEIVDRLRQYNVGFVSCTESIDTNTPFGNAMLSILGVFAELERSLIQERTSGGREQAIQKGEWMNDKYGYKRVKNMPEVFEEEAEVVRLIFDLFVNQRYSIAGITKELRDRKILVPIANKSKKRKAEGMDRVVHDVYKRGDKTVRQILKDEVYIGEYYYGKTTTDKNLKTGSRKLIERPRDLRSKTNIKHESIIEPELFQQAQEIFEMKSGGTNIKSNSDYILSGLLKCCGCSHPRKDDKPLHMKGAPGGSHQYYQCNGKNSGKFPGRRCTVIPLPKKELEDFVIAQIKEFFGKPENFQLFIDQHKSNGTSKKLLNDERERAIKQYEKGKKSLETIKQLHIATEIDYEEYKRQTEAKKMEMEKLEARILDIKRTLKEQADTEKYETGMRLVKDMVGENLDKLFKDRKLLQKFLGYLISEIFVYSRDATDKDSITGKKKAGGEIQKIPYAIDIQMRLPQEIIQSLYEEAKSNIDLREEESKKIQTNSIQEIESLEIINDPNKLK